MLRGGLESKSDGEMPTYGMERHDKITGSLNNDTINGFGLFLIQSF
jgi:hypothetical protein